MDSVVSGLVEEMFPSPEAPPAAEQASESKPLVRRMHKKPWQQSPAGVRSSGKVRGLCVVERCD